MNAGFDEEADYVVVGSGAAGATVALDLARAGADVLVLEEGGWYTREDFRPDLYSALSRLWRDFGGQVAAGRSTFPIAQGCCVGGSTVVNGAAMNRLPREIWDGWVANDPALSKALPWAELEQAAESIETELQVTRRLAPTIESLPMSQALERLGYDYRPMTRSAPGCQHRDRCLQGCPSGGKWSMERSFIPTALELGARLLPDRRVERILYEGRRATGVLATRREGARHERRARRVRIGARRAVILAAGAVHTPLLLRRSGVQSPHVGRNFRCHIGSVVSAEFSRPVREIEGLWMGYEAFPLPDLKCNSLRPTPPEIALGNIPVVGRELTDLVRRFDHLAIWNNSLTCEAEGRVRGRWLGLPYIQLTPTQRDLSRVREAVYHLARLMFEAGATNVFPGIHGIPRRLTDADQVEQIQQAPLDPRGYTLNVSHLFGTAKMAGTREAGVVDPSFRCNEFDGLFVVDASVFPTNIGTNPQLAVMTLARHAARKIPEWS